MSRRRASLVTLVATLVILLASPDPVHTEAAIGSSALDVVISKIAWMGTEASSDDEWIELFGEGHKSSGQVDGSESCVKKPQNRRFCPCVRAATTPDWRYL